MASGGRKARNQRKETVPKAVLLAGLCVLLLILVVVLVQIVIKNGSSLINNDNELPGETQAVEDVWVPDVAPAETRGVEEVVAPRYDPKISENADFSGGEDSGGGVPVDDLTGQQTEENLPSGDLFEPEEFEEE